MAVDERPEVSLSIPQGTLPWQVIYVRFIGFYPQNWVRGFARHGRWSRTTRNASDALDAGKPINWKNSHFTHALHDNNHVTTVRDSSLLRVESYRNPIAPPTTAELSTAVFFIATHG